ncbi:MAG TPA: hypothetical protein VN374_00150 [Desulfitobacteriaceae bacterium]|nr:hypothetical protein [Desulfitobacteriaceae bacterium]
MRRNKYLFISVIIVMLIAAIAGCGSAKDNQSPGTAPYGAY